MPMAVLPCLMASREYSTWKRRPSGEKVLVGVSECTEEGGLGGLVRRGGGEGGFGGQGRASNVLDPAVWRENLVSWGLAEFAPRLGRGVTCRILIVQQTCRRC